MLGENKLGLLVLLEESCWSLQVSAEVCNEPIIATSARDACILT